MVHICVMQSTLGPNATEESKKDFPKQWQEMVKTIFDNAGKVIELKVINPEY